MSHITASAFLSCFVGGEGGRREKVSHVLVWEKVSHVTVSGAWREEGQGVTCNGLLGGSGSRGVGKGEHWYSHCMHHCVLHPRADALTQRSCYKESTTATTHATHGFATHAVQGIDQCYNTCNAWFCNTCWFCNAWFCNTWCRKVQSFRRSARSNLL